MVKTKTVRPPRGSVVIKVEGLRYALKADVSHTFEAPWKSMPSAPGYPTTVSNATSFETLFTAAKLQIPDDVETRYFRVTVEEVQAKDYRVQYDRKGKTKSKRP